MEEWNQVIPDPKCRPGSGTAECFTQPNDHLWQSGPDDILLFHRSL